MKRPSQNIELFETAKGQSVSAILYEGLVDKNLECYYKRWRPILEEDRRKKLVLQAQGVQVRGPEDAHWDWNKKFERTQKMPLVYRDFVIEYSDETEGYMQLNLATQRSRLDSGKPLVYVEFLQTAPWNRKSIVETPKFRRVGTLLLLQAMGISKDEGFGGRIGLHSLPAAVGFYQKMCMQFLGKDSVHHNLEYCEIRSQDAEKLLL